MNLGERLYLIAFDPGRRKGTANPQLALPYGLAGAVVMDLVLNHGTQLVGGKVVASEDTGDAVLDDALGRIRADRKPRDVKHWVKKLAGRSVNLEGKIAGSLVGAGVLAERDERVLLINLKRYDLREVEPRDDAMATVRQAISGDAPVDAETASLVALAGSCGLIDRLVDKDSRKAARERAKSLTKQEIAGKAVSSAVQEVEAAVMAGVIAAVVASSSVSSSGHGH